MKNHRAFWAASFCFFALQAAVFGQTNYVLFHGSYLLDECLICGRPSIPRPIGGSFLLGAGPTPMEYVISGIRFTNEDVVITGGGELKADTTGRGALLTLDLNLDRGFTNEVLHFVTNPESAAEPGNFPMLRLMAKEDPGSLVRTFTIALNAAPLTEILFSIRGGAVPSVPAISGADILGMSGEVFRRGEELTANLQLADPFQFIEADAFDISAAGQIFFSTSEDLERENLPKLSNGDAIAENGLATIHNPDLLAAFKVNPPNSELGLDALQQMPGGIYWFSFATGSAASEKIGAQIFNGDVLSSDGRIIKTYQQLVAAFQPFQVGDFGLDALHAWPNGEIWFSTERGFSSANGEVSDGDILSDAGYIVFTNGELMRAFGVSEPGNLGLDGLKVVSSLGQENLTPPEVLISKLDAELIISWTGSGRYSQVLSSATLPGAFVPVSPLMLEKNWRAPENSAAVKFYIVRQYQ